MNWPAAGHVDDRGGLGDLEDQAAWRNVGAVELAADEREQLGVADRQAGEVDLEYQRLVARVVLGEQRDRVLGDPPVDLLHHPEPFGDVEERARRDVVAVFVAHPQQQLVLARAAGREVDDRLCQKHEPVMLERCADPLRPRDAALHRRALLLAGRVELRAVTPGVLGVVHR